MSLGNIVVTLSLDDGKFTGKIRGAKSELAKLQKSVADTDGGMRGAETTTKSWGSTLRDYVVILGLANNALYNLNSLILGMPRSILRTNAEMERMSVLMAGLADDADNLADASANAAKNVDSMFELSSSSPYSIQAITDSFVKIKSGGIDPLEGGLQGLLDAVSRFGGTEDQFKRASIAIQQMSGKGVISMEELRQQLGEAVPDAVATAARALNMSVSNMVKIISLGRLEAQGALKSLFRQMQLENEGSASVMAETWDGLINRLKNSLILLQKDVGDAGFFEEMKAQIRDLIFEIENNPEFRQFAIDIGEALTALVKGIAFIISKMYEWSGVIKLLVTSFVALKGAQAIGGMMPALSKLTAYTDKYSRTVEVLTKRQRTLLFVDEQVGPVWARNADGMSKMEIRGRAAAAALSMMGKSLLSALGPLGLAVGAVWALEKAYYALIGSKREFLELQDKESQLFTDEDIERQKEGIKGLQEEIDELQKRIDQGFFQYRVGDNLKTQEYTEQELEKFRQDIEAKQVQIAAAQQKLDDALAASLERRARVIFNEAKRRVDTLVLQESNGYKRLINGARQAIEEEFGTLDSAEAQERLAKDAEQLSAATIAARDKIFKDEEAALRQQADALKTLDAQKNKERIDALLLARGSAGRGQKRNAGQD